MELSFRGDVFHWRGPSPYHFVAVPEDESAEIHAVAALVTYGWGVIPVTARIGATEWTTSLLPKNGGYLVPLKDVVRMGESLEVGMTVAVTLSITV
ncbi:MAG: DUF1905 domain-containing protein [Nocardioidaceae bacterium]|nr:DUF1905 domain-containing protein [Nocardioidaceae bacterium]